MDGVVLFSEDLILFLRLFGAFLWGLAWAAFLQKHPVGQFLASQRTWLTVVVGVGGDMILSYPESWWTVMGCIAFSSIGIIGRSLLNESDDKEYRRNMVLRNVGDVIALLMRMEEMLVALTGQPELTKDSQAVIAKVLKSVRRSTSKLFDAQNGQYRDDFIENIKDALR